MASAHPDDGELAQLVERALPEARRAELEAHLERCEACADAVGFLVEAFASRESVPQVDAERGALPGKGDALGRYVILDWIGAGAMGAVYSAFDPELDRRVALKLLPPRRGEEGERLRARFLSEARAMASVSHPNVIRVHDVGQRDDLAYFAMELVEGQTLGEWRAARARSVDEIVDTFVDAARGLAAAHARGLVHRDFKPSNALIGDDGRVRVIDFGLARFAEESVDTRPPEEEPLDLPSPDTRTGTLIGTPAYMAPEQLAGDPSDAAADQFAFCVSLYEAIHGRRPFAGATLLALAEAIDEGLPRDSPVPVPRRIHRVLTRGLQKRPGDRYPSMDALVSALTARPFAGWGPTGLVAIAMGGLAVAVHAAVTGEADIRCDPDAAQLADVWDQSRRTALIDALAPAQGPDATRTMAHWLADRIDDYADEWASARHEACVATLEKHEQSFAMMDRQVACLRRARAQLRSNVTTLIERGVSDPGSLPVFIDALPPVESCRDAAALRAGPPPPPPLLAGIVDAHRSALADAKALHLVADFRGALEISERVLEATADVPYPPLRYEARLARAFANTRLAEIPRAQEDMVRVLDEALAAGDQVVAGRTAASLACMSASDLGKPDAGLAYAKTALGLTPASEGNPSLRSLALRCTSRALKYGGKFEAAEERLREAIKVLEAAGDAHVYEQGRARVELGQALMRRHETSKAVEQFQLARGIFSEAFGPDHHDAVEASAELASAMVDQGRYEEAEREYARVIDIWTRAGGPRAPRIGIIHGKLGNLFYAQKRYDDAEGEYREASDILAEALGQDHPTVLSTEASLANVYTQRGDLPKAVDVYLSVIPRFESGASARHPMAAQLRSSAGSSLIRLRRFEAALRAVEPSVPACTEGRDVPRGVCAELELVRARAKLELGDPEAAARHLASVRAYHEEEEPPPLETRAFVDELAGDIARARGG